MGKRYKDQWNIIWLNGGDIIGSEEQQVWKTIGETLRANDQNHLITFHPRGRTASSDWFHNASWLDFNMVQSGHRRYDQDTIKKEKTILDKTIGGTSRSIISSNLLNLPLMANLLMKIFHKVCMI